MKIFIDSIALRLSMLFCIKNSGKSFDFIILKFNNQIYIKSQKDCINVSPPKKINPN